MLFYRLWSTFYEKSPKTFLSHGNTQYLERWQNVNCTIFMNSFVINTFKNSHSLPCNHPFWTSSSTEFRQILWTNKHSIGVMWETWSATWSSKPNLNTYETWYRIQVLSSIKTIFHIENFYKMLNEKSIKLIWNMNSLTYTLCVWAHAQSLEAVM